MEDVPFVLDRKIKEQGIFVIRAIIGYVENITHRYVVVAWILVMI
jgi:hypothetical protein